MMRVFLLLFSIEWRSKERLLSPLLFALAIVALVRMVFGERLEAFETEVFLAAWLLPLFLGLQLLFIRLYDPELRDGVLSIMRVQGRPLWWFFASRLLIAWSQAFLLAAVVMGFLCMQQTGSVVSANAVAKLLVIGAVGLFGLCALGSLLSILLQQQNAKALLFPLLFFPLSLPVFLALSQSGFQVLTEGLTLAELTSSWIGLLVAFDLVFGALGFVLFDEIASTD